MPSTPFIPTEGMTYRNGNGLYLCKRVVNDREAWLQHRESAWTFLAHDIYCNEDGSIHWWYSKGGYFEEAQVL